MGSLHRQKTYGDLWMEQEVIISSVPSSSDLQAQQIRIKYYEVKVGNCYQ